MFSCAIWHLNYNVLMDKFNRPPIITDIDLELHQFMLDYQRKYQRNMLLADAQAALHMHKRGVHYRLAKLLCNGYVILTLPTGCKRRYKAVSKE